MFSVIFPGQGSQAVGMGKEFYEKYEIVKKLFKEADEVLGANISKIVLEGCLLYTSPSPRDTERSRMPSSA